MDKMIFYGVFFVAFVPTISIAMSSSDDVDYFRGVEAPTSHSCLIPSHCEQIFPGLSQDMHTQSELMNPYEQKKLLISKYKVTNQSTMNENLQEENNYEDSSKKNPTDEKRVLLDRLAKVAAGTKIKSSIEIPPGEGIYTCPHQGCGIEFTDRKYYISHQSAIHKMVAFHRFMV